MGSFTVSFVQLADGEVIQVAATDVVDENFRVFLLSPQQLEVFRLTTKASAEGVSPAGTHELVITKHSSTGSFPAVPSGGWFVVFRNGEAVGVRLATTRTKPLVNGGSG